MDLRDERTGDEAGIAALIARAFAASEHGDNGETAIVAALRRDGALAVSLVAVEDAGGTEAVVGHVAFSPVTIDGASSGWFGLGPVSVAPERQRYGIGAALIAAGLDRLRAEGAAGCVVLGEPGYYRRFGFRASRGLTYPGPPAEYFQALAFGGAHPAGIVAYHPAFG